MNDEPDFKKIPLSAREDIVNFTIGLLKVFDAARPPLPTEQITFGQPWKGTRELMIGSTGPTETAIADINSNYMGTRTRRDKPEALLALKGQLRGQKGERANLGGKLIC